MLEAGQDVAFGQEEPDDMLRVHSAADELQSDLFSKPSAGLNRQIDRAHAAVPDLPHDVVGPDARGSGRKKVADIALPGLPDGFSQIESRQVVGSK